LLPAGTPPFLATFTAKEIFTIWFNRAVNLADWGKKENNDSMLREAVDHFSKALKLRPEYGEADRAIQQLKFDIKARKKK
jgi:hypothetical protein